MTAHINAACATMQLSARVSYVALTASKIIIIIIIILLKQNYKIQLANNKIQMTWLIRWPVVG